MLNSTMAGLWLLYLLFHNIIYISEVRDHMKLHALENSSDHGGLTYFIVS